MMRRPTRKFLRFAWCGIAVAHAYLATTGLSRFEDELRVVEAGQSDYQIVCTKGSMPATLLAATELQSFVERATGVRLPIVSPARRGVASILFQENASLPWDGFSIRTSGRDVVIVGRVTDGDPKIIDFERPVSCGTLYGAYEFLERFVGVRFYWPEDLGTIVPKNSTLSLPKFVSIEQSPHFSLRKLQKGPGYVRYGEEHATRIWGRRLRLGSSMPTRYHHNWWRVLNVETAAQQGHPEYAALVGGVRQTRYREPGRFHNGQVCTSNPEVIETFSRAAKSSPLPMFSLSPNDGVGFCECTSCQELDTGKLNPDGRRKGTPNLSDRMISFYNSVARRSGRVVGGYAYNEFIEVPTTVKLNDNVWISIAIDTAYIAGRPGEVERTDRLLRQWGAYSPRATVYDIFYLKLRTPDLIIPLGTDVDHLIRSIARAGLAGADFYIAPEMELGGADAYVTARMLWNPNVDTQRIREQYYRDLYGLAWRPVQAVFQVAAKQWRRAVAIYPGAGKQRHHQRKILGELRDLIEEAIILSRDDPAAAARVTRLEDAVERMGRTQR